MAGHYQPVNPFQLRFSNTARISWIIHIHSSQCSPWVKLPLKEFSLQWTPGFFDCGAIHQHQAGIVGQISLAQLTKQLINRYWTLWLKDWKPWHSPPSGAPHGVGVSSFPSAKSVAWRVVMPEHCNRRPPVRAPVKFVLWIRWFLKMGNPKYWIGTHSKWLFFWWCGGTHSLRNHHMVHLRFVVPSLDVASWQMVCNNHKPCREIYPWGTNLEIVNHHVW